MTQGDLDTVMRLEAITSEAPHWERAVYQGFLSEEDHAKQIFVAEGDGGLIGFVAAQITLDVCELDSIVVEAGVRRNGVGKVLVSTLMDWLRRESITRIQLEVRARNRSAIEFYERLGFVKDGLRRRYYRDPEDDALLMSRVLERRTVG
jgi:ribosomal-protein-alanine N-acetyltransferase